MINQIRGQSQIQINSRTNSNGESPAKGTVLNGFIVTKTAEKAAFLLEIGGKEQRFEVDAKSIVGEAGDEVSFEVVSGGKDGLALKQIFTKSESQRMSRDTTKQLSPKAIKDELDNSLQGRTKRVLGLDEQSRVRQAAARLRRLAENGAQNLTGEAVALIANSGIALHNISLNMLNSAVNAASAKPVPDTPDFAETAVKDIQGITRAQAAAVIRTERPLTVENVYTAKRHAPQNGGQTVSRDMRGKLHKHLESQNIPITEENLENAEFLLENDLPIDQENIEKAETLLNFPKLEEKAVITALREYKNEGNNPRKLLLQEITERLKTAQLTAKLTFESAARFGLDTTAISETVQNLTERQQVLARELFLYGETPTFENISRIERTLDRVNMLSRVTYNAFADILNGNRAETVNEIAKSVNEAENAQESSRAFRARAEEYQRFEAVVNPRYGDRFAKVAEQLAPIVESLELSATDQNIRAARILSVNGIDITFDNIMSVKALDARISEVAKRTTPASAIAAMKSGADILNMPLDELLETLDAFDTENKGKAADSAAERIIEWRTQNGNDINPETDNAVIALYQLLNSLENGNAAAVLLSQQKEPTLRHLIEAAKTAKTIKRGQDISVDGNTRAVVQYNNTILGRLDRFMNAQAAAKVIENNPEYQDIPLETLISKLESEQPPQTNTAALESKIAAYLSGFTRSPQSLNYAAQTGIPLTLGALNAAKQYSDDPDFFSREIDAIDAEIAITADELNENDIETVFARIDNDLINAMKDAPPEKIERIDATRRALKLQEFLYETGKAFRLPVSIGSKTADIELFAHIQSESVSSIRMFLRTPQNGDIAIDLTTTEYQSVTVRFSSTNTELAQKLNETDPTVFLSADTTRVKLTQTGGAMPEHAAKLIAGIAAYIEDTSRTI